MNKDTRLSDVLHLLMHLSLAEVPVTSDVLAKELGTNPSVLRRTMGGLRSAGYVRADKGPGGGWMLARPLREVTLLDVYNALGRPMLFAIANRSDAPDCAIAAMVNATLANTMSSAETLFMNQFAAITLDSLLPEAVSRCHLASL